MLPTRSERRRNAPFFHQCYADLCKLRNIAPNAGVKARAGKNMLDICGDRLKMDEWAPILEALRHDRNLHFIAFRCRYPVKSVLEDVDTEAKARAVTKRPVFLSKFIFHLLMDSLAQCLAESTSVTCIELDGLPLTKEYMFILCKGIAANTSLQTISFCNSPIGDEGCKQLCLLVRNMPSVLHLDLSNCDLKPGSAGSLAETLKYQSLQRFAESWKQSLRYREPNIESMPGLRRIILNNNVHLGDEGVNTLTDVLKEDFWIRAIDLQNCGVSNMGALSILETLEINSTLCIVDVRDNRYIDDAVLHKIMVKLFHNNANKDAHEYNWIIPRSQLTYTPSNVTLRSRPSVMCNSKRNASLKSLSSAGLQSLNQRCMSQCTIKKDVLINKKIPTPTRVIVKLQRNMGSASQSSTAIKLATTDALSSRGCVSRMKETMQKFKKLNTQNSSPAFLGKKTESKYENLNSNLQEKTKILKTHSEKNGYCLMKQEAYDAVFETLGRFYMFIEHIKQTNKVLTPENGNQGGGDSASQYENKFNSEKASKEIAETLTQDNPATTHQKLSQEEATEGQNELEITSQVSDIHNQKKLIGDYDPSNCESTEAFNEDSLFEIDNTLSERCSSPSPMTKIQGLYESLVQAGDGFDTGKTTAWMK